MKIFLIGLPGSGKTTLGKQLAEKLNFPFFDLDAEIERQEGTSVQAIFSTKSENYFRQVESEMLKSFCQREEGFVMATGGGEPCFFDNMERMNRSGKTVFLDVPASEIATRLQKTNLIERPLLSKLSPDQLKDKIEWLRSQRIPFYRQAKFIFSSTSISSDEIIEAIKG